MSKNKWHMEPPFWCTTDDCTCGAAPMAQPHPLATKLELVDHFHSPPHWNMKTMAPAYPGNTPNPKRRKHDTMEHYELRNGKVQLKGPFDNWFMLSLKSTDVWTQVWKTFVQTHWKRLWKLGRLNIMHAWRVHDSFEDYRLEDVFYSEWTFTNSNIQKFHFGFWHDFCRNAATLKMKRGFFNITTISRCHYMSASGKAQYYDSMHKGGRFRYRPDDTTNIDDISTESDGEDYFGAPFDASDYGNYIEMEN